MRAFLDELPAPWLAVPGNHDVPLYDLVRRVFAPLARYHRFISRRPRAAPARRRPAHPGPGLDAPQGDGAPDRPERIAEIHDADVLVTHHPLVRRPLEGAEAALAAARAAGVQLVLAGHHHRYHLTPGDPIAVEGPSTSHLLEPRKGFVVLRIGPDGDRRGALVAGGNRVRSRSTGGVPAPRCVTLELLGGRMGTAE